MDGSDFSIKFSIVYLKINGEKNEEVRFCFFFIKSFVKVLDELSNKTHYSEDRPSFFNGTFTNCDGSFFLFFLSLINH